jgi:hypothetical protein
MLDLLMVRFSCFHDGLALPVDPLLALGDYLIGAIAKFFRLLIYIVQSLGGASSDVLSQFFPGPGRKQ